MKLYNGLPGAVKALNAVSFRKLIRDRLMDNPCYSMGEFLRIDFRVNIGDGTNGVGGALNNDSKV